MLNVKTYISPYAHVTHDTYTAYYREGLAEFLKNTGGTFAEISISKHPSVLYCLRRLRNAYKVEKIMGKLKPAVDTVLDYIARVIGGNYAQETEGFTAGLGCYIFQTSDGIEWKAYIDSQDSGAIRSPQALDWSDLYFKTSYSREHDYPAKVIPLSQCSFLLVGRLDRLRSMRTKPKRYDLCFTTRVWGGSNDIEGIEHNLRLLEALAKVNCRKYLRAFLIAGDKTVYAKRLDRQGSPYSFDPLPMSDHVWGPVQYWINNPARYGPNPCRNKSIT